MSVNPGIPVRFHAPPLRVRLVDPDASLFPFAQPEPLTSEAGPGPGSSIAEPVSADQPEPHPRLPETEQPVASAADVREAEIARQLDEEKTAVRATLESLAAAIQQLREEHRAALASCRQAAIELAVTIATRLIHDRIVADDFAVESIVREALEMLGPRGPVTVRLEPRDLQLLESRTVGATLFTREIDIRTVADATLARGSCRIDGRDASVSTRLSEQLATIRADLLRSLADVDA